MLATADTAQLVKGAQVGSIEDFAILVERYEHELYRYLVSKLGDNEEAHDFVQQVFFKAWLKLDTLQNVSCFGAWLFSIARHLLCDYWRAKRLLSHSWEDLTNVDAATSCSGPEEFAGEVELIRLALAELAPKLRRCLILREVCGYSPYEIAITVGISESSVGTYISLARKQFRAIYKGFQNKLEIEQ